MVKVVFEGKRMKGEMRKARWALGEVVVFVGFEQNQMCSKRKHNLVESTITNTISRGELYFFPPFVVILVNSHSVSFDT